MFFKFSDKTLAWEVQVHGSYLSYQGVLWVLLGLNAGLESAEFCRSHRAELCLPNSPVRAGILNLSLDRFLLRLLEFSIS